MLPLSVAIIARDEADRLPDALASVAGLAAQVVVLDSGSRDDTVALARAAGAEVVETDWPGHVAQKNRALQRCTQEWVLSLDADERLSPALAASVRAALAEPGDAAGFEVDRLSWWQGAPLRYGTWHPDRRLRLVRRAVARWEGDDPHDRLAVDGPTRRLDGDLLHHPYRDLGEHLSTIDRYTATAAKALAARGVRATVLDVALRPHLHIVKALLLKQGIRDGVRGLCVAGLGATYVLLKWGRLYLAQRATTGASG
ncbi:MAG: glycosyltransferase family 2 protein [Alphaproteobacteria bacterium]|nr:glycosyltransferase family 2 protein [Alphaproteobacteria bacterium]